MLCLGLMSGTSADGVDAVLARFSGPPINRAGTCSDIGTRPTRSSSGPD